MVGNLKICLSIHPSLTYVTSWLKLAKVIFWHGTGAAPPPPPAAAVAPNDATSPLELEQLEIFCWGVVQVLLWSSLIAGLKSILFIFSVSQIFWGKNWCSLSIIYLLFFCQKNNRYWSSLIWQIINKFQLLMNWVRISMSAPNLIPI